MPKLLRFLFLCLAAFFTGGCISTSSNRDDDHAFKVKYVDFQFSRVPEIRQSEKRSCGAAALTSLVRYWNEDSELEEREILNNYPPTSADGYPMLQLRDIAVKEKLLAFAVTLDKNPMKQLSAHLRKGRPILIAAQMPHGRYFGDRIPLIETLDRRTVQVNGVGGNLKAHYLVVMGESAREVLLMDPQYGTVHTSKVDFERFWKRTGYAALITSALPGGVSVGSSSQ